MSNYICIQLIYIYSICARVYTYYTRKPVLFISQRFLSISIHFFSFMYDSTQVFWRKNSPIKTGKQSRCFLPLGRSVFLKDHNITIPSPMTKKPCNIFPNCSTVIHYLVGGFSPTQLKTMRTSILDHFPNFRGENLKYLKPPPRYLPTFCLQFMGQRMKIYSSSMEHSGTCHFVPSDVQGILWPKRISYLR